MNTTGLSIFFVQEVTKLALDDVASAASSMNKNPFNTDEDYEENPFLIGADFESPHSEDPEPTENNSRGLEE